MCPHACPRTGPALTRVMTRLGRLLAFLRRLRGGARRKPAVAARVYHDPFPAETMNGPDFSAFPY